MGSKQIYPMLVIDTGNTSVKIALVGRRRAAPRLLARVATAKLTPERVELIVRRNACKSAVASCVVPAARKALRAGCPFVSFIGRSTHPDFATLVDRRTVGADRLANMAAAAAAFGESTLVADFGTAATFDLLDGSGRFAGGAIAPGLHALARCLTDDTAQLPAGEMIPPRRAAGRDTREALRSGVVGGYAGLVRHLLREMPARHVVFTGGDARLVAKLAGRKVKIDPLWTLKGISILADP